MTTITPLTRRATSVYRSASDEQIINGRAWYPSAHEIARSQADEYGVTIEVASGVLAALSPRMGWAPNVMIAERMLASGGTMQDGALGRSLSQARAIHSGTDPLDVLGGPKTRAFYQAILTAGKADDPVIDRHAWDMLTGVRFASPPTTKQYREGADRMTRAARILSVQVSELQAVTWLAWRERFWSASAFNTVQTPMFSLNF